MKWLIVNGDDFGMSDGINHGILVAHRRGILTSASLFVNGCASENAARVGREWPTLSLGLHLELDPDNRGRVVVDLERQLAHFVALVGTAPTHVDSHHDVHQDPRVLPYVVAWAREARLPVRGHSMVRHLSKFYGQWGGRTHLEQIEVNGLLKLLDAEIGDGVTELTCHPGYVEPGFPSSYGSERAVELRTLCDQQVRQAIIERGIRLVGFRDVPALATGIASKEAT